MSYESDSDEEDFLLLLALSRKKRIWVHDINKKREQYGEYHRLCRELESDDDRFFSYFRMSKNSYEELHQLLELQISKKNTNYRASITSRQRLAICIRYLSTGDSFQTIAFSFRVGSSTVSLIVREVCKAIWDTLQPIYIPAPTEAIWKQSETGYRELWGFPNCPGSIDGKHVRIECPSNSGSQYYCYKSYFSIVLLAIVDPHYKFLVVDIGSYGRQSDSGIFENTVLYKECVAGKYILPPKPLPGTNDPVPHVLIGDEGFGLKPFLMRPFPKTAALHDERKKNLTTDCAVRDVRSRTPSACCLKNGVYFIDPSRATSKQQPTL
ncbi:protein ALP1-like [Leguminivora glycinivorella]|uniref:protein ALP1-like n=1 Tax=Leguminivora glycinivorella TaxID=1035111 RepID=UPI00200E5492|nr:protein ALP1-like [Leguminivora glycinivorella]